MKNFSIPGYFHHYKECRILIEMHKAHPNWFYEDRGINSVYDFPSGFLWNGGRVYFDDRFDPFYLHEIMNYYFSIPTIKLYHTCTNLFIDENLTHDYLCNKFFEQYYRPCDYIIVASPILRDYLIQNFCAPDKIIYSTTLCINDINQVNKITESNKYVIDYNYNNDDNYLDQLQHKGNVELLCAEPCEPNCPNRMQHYEKLSKYQLWNIDFENDNSDMCPFKSNFSSVQDIQSLSTAIDNDRIEKLQEKGFEYFKISGRSLETRPWMELMFYYLIYPQFRTIAKHTFQNQLSM